MHADSVPNDCIRRVALLLTLLCFQGAARGQVYVMGKGSFDARPNSREVAQGDFNNDGKLDLVVLSTSSFPNPDMVSMFLGRSDGTFGNRADFPIGDPSPSQASDLAIGDFNGDGNLDVAVTSQSLPTVSIFLGTGDGGLGSPSYFSLGGLAGSGSVSTGDLNEDGYLDLVVVEAELTVLLGSGDGTFGAPTAYPVGLSSVVISDFNADGHDDVAGTSGDSVSVLLGNGDGTFQSAAAYAAEVGAQSIIAVDFNQDGAVDVAMANYLSPVGGVSVLLGTGFGTFGQAATYPTGSIYTSTFSVTSADINGDGVPDFAATIPNGNEVSVLLGAGDGTFSDGVTYSGGINPVSVVAADYSGDGNADLAIAGGYFTPRGELSILIGHGDGTFQAHVDYPTAPFPRRVEQADFNGDGKADLAVSSFDSNGSASILLGNGDGTFQSHVDYAVGGFAEELAPGDFDNDGKTDLAVNVGTPFAEVISVLLGNGDGSLQSPLSQQVSSIIRSLVAADFNADGNLDLAATIDYTYAVSVFLGRGDGTFLDPVPYATGPVDPTSPMGGKVFAGDFNNDDRIDLVASTANALSLLLGNGDGTFGSHQEFWAGHRYALVAAGDFNGDGRFDLAVRNPSPVSVAILLGNGDGTFQAANVFLIPPLLSVEEVTVSDFNSDGKLDLALLSQQAPVNILLGAGDGTFQSLINYIGGDSPVGLGAGDFNADGGRDLAIANLGGDSVSIFLNEPVVALHPRMLQFPDQALGGISDVQTVTLSNPGSMPLRISQIAVSADYAENHTCGDTLLVGESCTIDVSFFPLEGGLRPGTLTVSDSAPSQAQMVGLTGTGTAPSVSLSPLVLVFEGQLVGTVGPSSNVNLTNLSGAPLNIMSIAVSSDYEESDDCGATVPVGGGCAINVRFAPKASGERPAAVTITSNAPGSPHTVALSGTGTDFAVGAASGGSMSATVSAGGTATYNLSVAPSGFAGTAALACAWKSAQPRGTGCTLSAASVNLDGTQPAAFTVTVTTTRRALAPPGFLPDQSPLQPFSAPPGQVWLAWLAALALFGLGLVVLSRRWPRQLPAFMRLAPLAGLMLVALLWVACGGGGGGGGAPASNSSGTPAGTYTLTVTATADGASRTADLTLTVN